MRAGVAPDGSERIQKFRTSIRQDRPIEDGAGLATKSRGESVEASRGVEGAVLGGCYDTFRATDVTAMALLPTLPAPSCDRL